jgi:hypothetical protein
LDGIAELLVDAFAMMGARDDAFLCHQFIEDG